MTIVEIAAIGLAVTSGLVAALALRHAHQTATYYRGVLDEHVRQLHRINDTWGKSSQDLLASQIGIMDIIKKAVGQ